jgi:RNA polymerase sigma-70 factor (ECF subfamily)
VYDTEGARFERLILPHLGASYNLARWVLHNAADAEDVVQEAYLRAFRSFDGYRGGDPRAWLLTIVRNTCYTWLRQHRGLQAPQGDEGDAGVAELPDNPAGQPEALLLREADAQLLRDALEALPLDFREAVVLRELEGLSYKEIAAVTGVALGTVMSRLARARKQLQRYVVQRRKDG